MATVRINGAAVRRIAGGAQAEAFMLRLGNRIRNNAASRCNVDSGRLRSSLQVILSGPGSMLVGTDVEYAIYVHNGTRPHLIEPVTARVLHWIGPGGEVFAARAYHPGYGGNPFLTDAVEDEVRALG